MRKSLALAALLLTLACGIAQAGYFDWTSDHLDWKHQAGGIASDSARTGVIRKGDAGQTGLDTTVAFPLVECKFIDNGNLAGKTAAVDSLPHLAFSIYPTASTNYTAAADSFGLVTQVSMDGNTWISMTPNHVFDATRAAGSRIAIYVENNSMNGVTVLFKNIGVAAYAAGTAFTLDGATAPTDLQWFGWRYVRFILQGCGMTGEYSASIDHWRYVE